MRLLSKPPGGYPNYYEKMTAYIKMLAGHAQTIDPTATPITFRASTHTEDTVFRYLDSASGRAGISGITDKLKLAKVAIVGLGGTGSYILDLTAKIPVEELHLYDRDVLYTHNAFRSPGAASVEELNNPPKKVEYFRAKYDPMRRNIFAHPVHIDEDTVEELRSMTFVFLAIDAGPSKRPIIEKLEQFGVPFIDTGMGVYQVGESLGGLLRVTTSSDSHRCHIWEKQRISFDDEQDNEYDRNIQIADLNALNAALAVIKWKKMFGFYSDFENEYSSVYTIDGNHMLNEDQLE